MGVCERRLFIEPQNMIQAIFLDCDKDNDGALNAEEYASFLKTIGTWGKHNVRAASPLALQALPSHSVRLRGTWIGDSGLTLLWSSVCG